MTDEQHMQKAREITAGWRKASHTPWENVHADIASALSEAYRSGVEEEREITDAKVEAAARGMCKHNRCDPDEIDTSNGDSPQPLWMAWEDEARAALTATIRKP